MKSRIAVTVNNETALKLKKRAKRVGMTTADALRHIVIHGPESFLRLLVGATKGAKH